MARRNLYGFPPDAILVLTPGPIDPDKLSPAALRALPGRRIRWATGHRVDRAAARAEPGDLIVSVADLAEADRWYFALLRADGLEPWWVVRRRERLRARRAAAAWAKPTVASAPKSRRRGRR